MQLLSRRDLKAILACSLIGSFTMQNAQSLWAVTTMPSGRVARSTTSSRLTASRESVSYVQRSRNVGALARAQLELNGAIDGSKALFAPSNTAAMGAASRTPSGASSRTPSGTAGRTFVQIAKLATPGKKAKVVRSAKKTKSAECSHKAPLSRKSSLELHNLISSVATSLAKCRQGETAPKTLKKELDRLGLAIAPRSFDESPLARSSEALVALFCGGVILGKEKGAHYRKRAIALLAPPKRKLVYSGGKHIKLLKAGDNRYREICLTFDDGPSPHSAKLLDVLARYEIPATFFIIGHRITRHPDILRRMVADGHTIANHSWRHDRQPRLSSKTITNRLAWFDKHLRKALGENYSCDYYRLPYNSGKKNERINRTLAPHFKYLLDWSIDPRDWDWRQRRKVVDNVMNHSRKRGGILLMHDNQKASYLPSIVDKLVRTLIKNDFRFVSLDELIGCDEGTQLRKQLVKAMKLVEKGAIRAAYRQAMLVARDHRAAGEADEALFMASILACLIEEKRDTIPAKVAKYLRRRYKDSPFAVIGGLRARSLEDEISSSKGKTE